MLRVNQAYLDALTAYEESISSRLKEALTPPQTPRRETPRTPDSTGKKGRVSSSSEVSDV